MNGLRKRLTLVVSVKAEMGGKQLSGIAVPRIFKDSSNRPRLDDPAMAHDRHLIGQSGYDAEIVGHQQHSNLFFPPQSVDQLKNSALDDDVEIGGRLVGDQQPSLKEQGEGDHDPL